MLHVGGLENFRSVFGDDSPFLLVLCRPPPTTAIMIDTRVLHRGTA